jgi:hypothetical protein
MDIEDRARLEVGFAEQIGRVIDKLVYAEFSEEETLTFINSLKTFLKFDDLKDYILDALFDKIKEVAKLIKPHDQVRFSSFRKLIKILLTFTDQETLGALQTFLVRDNLSDHFFVLLEEMVVKEVNTKEAEGLFISLIGLHDISLKLINRFLKILNKDAAYLAIHLLQNSNYLGLRRFISQLGSEHGEELEQLVVPVILQHYIGDRTHYLGLTLEVVCVAPQLTHTLLHDASAIGLCEKAFSDYLITNHVSNIVAIKNFLLYLQQYNPQNFIAFEDAFLRTARVDLILQYALQTTFSNKRKILRRLVECKHEATLVEFIKNFPEYDALLPML